MSVVGQPPKMPHVISITDGSQVGVIPPTVLLSLLPVLRLRDVDVLGKSCRQAQEELDTGEGLLHRCLCVRRWREGVLQRNEDVKRRRGQISCSLEAFVFCIGRPPRLLSCPMQQENLQVTSNQSSWLHRGNSSNVYIQQHFLGVRFCKRRAIKPTFK